MKCALRSSAYLVVLAASLTCLLLPVLQAQTTDTTSLSVLFVGDEISAEVSEDLLGFLEADPNFEADVRVFHTGDGNLMDAWSADTFLSTSLVQGAWDHVILQEKSQLPSFAYLADHPELYGESVNVPGEVTAGAIAFWEGGETVGRAVLDETSATLVLFPHWPGQIGAEGLSEFFPLADNSAMAQHTAASQEAFKMMLEGESERVRVPSIDGVWTHFGETMDLYENEPIVAGSFVHYLAAATLYREIARRPVESVGYDGGFDRVLAEEYRRMVDTLLDVDDPLEEFVPDPVDPVEDDPEVPDEEPEIPEEPEIVVENFDVLLSGASYTAAMTDILLGLFEADPRAALRTIRILGENGEDLFALTKETDALGNALVDEAWDVVVLEEASHQAGLTGVYANRRQAFDVGSPATYSLASYRFLGGGKSAIEQVFGQDDLELVFVSPWALQAGQSGLNQYPREKTPEAMQGYTLGGYQLLLDKVLPEGHERVRIANTGAAWLAGEVALAELDFYEEDGVLGAVLGRYVSACVLYENITGFRVAGNAFHAGLEEETVNVLQQIAGEASGIEGREPVPDDPEPEVPNGGEPDPDGEEPEVDHGKPLKVLLLGSRQLGLIERDLLGMLNADVAISPEVTLLLAGSLRNLWESEESKAKIVSGDWDVVILQEEQRQPGLAYISANHSREFFDVGTPAFYSLAAYNFNRAGKQLANFVLENTSGKMLLSASWAMDDSTGPLDEFPPNNDSRGMQSYTNAAYADFAASIPFQHRSRVSIVGVGDAWLKSRAGAPSLDLFSGSLKDGGSAGHFLTAAVFYQTLTGNDLTENSYRGVVRPVALEYLRAIVSDDDAASQLNYAGTATIQMPSLDFIDPEASIVDVFNASMDAVAPLQPLAGDHAIFQSYTSTGNSVWADNWTRDLDFSGVAWDHDTAGTLITDQYMVYARHFSRPIGSPVRFTDRNGDIVTRTVEAQEFIWFDHVVVRSDIMVVRLNEPVPDTVAVYRLVPGDLDPELLVGAKVINTYRQRIAYQSEASRFQLFDHDSEVVTTRRSADMIHSEWDHSVTNGDSGHPNFLVWNGELLLFSSHTFTGWGSKGPYLGGSGNQEKIVRAMANLAPAEED